MQSVKGKPLMDMKRKLGYLPVIAGSLAVGWVVKNYRDKIKQEDYESPLEKIRNAEQKLYRDGLKRANELELIKQEVQTKMNE